MSSLKECWRDFIVAACLLTGHIHCGGRGRAGSERDDVWRVDTRRVVRKGGALAVHQGVGAFKGERNLLAEA